MRRSVVAAVALAAMAAARAAVAQGDPPQCSAALTWTPPTENTDGTPLTDLAGYRLYAGCRTQGQYDHEYQIDDPALTSYVIEGLPCQGTCRFVSTAVNSTGVSSAYSNVASKQMGPGADPPGLPPKARIDVRWGDDVVVAPLAIVNVSRDYPVGTLGVDALVFDDRSYVYTDVGGLDGALYLRTLNDDKDGVADPWLTFELTRRGRVYVGFDIRHSRPPWLAGWNATQEIIWTTDTRFRLYSRDFDGQVALGPNALSGDASMYVVIVDGDR